MYPGRLPSRRALPVVLTGLLALGVMLAGCAPSPQGTTPAQARSAKQAPGAPASQPAAAPATTGDPAAGSFYAGKTLRIIVATTAGSAFDVYARVMARHTGKYIPGNPNVIVENMPGAGHLIGANYIYNLAEKDGTVIGTFV
jgi:hypothetical protein